MKKIYMFVASIMVLAASFSALPTLAQASGGASFNDNASGGASSYDCRTVSVLDYANPISNGGCWGSQSVTASPSGTVNVAIYYHNTSANTAHNVVVRLSPNGSGSTTSQSFTGSVSADNAGSVTGSATVNITSPSSLTFGKVVLYQNQSSSGQTLSNGANIFTSGINIGDIPGWSDCPITNNVQDDFCHQGWVFVSFKVGDAAQIQQCSIYANANPAVVQSGSSSLITWTTNGASSVTVNGQTQNANGSWNTGAVYSTQTYNLTANCNNGTQVNQTVTVNVNQVVVQQQCYVTAYATPATVQYGGSALLTWNSTGASGVQITGQGTQSASGSWNTGALYSSQSYTITPICSNGIAQSQTVYVTVAQQQIVAPTTLPATNITSYSARLNGLMPQITNGSGVSAYFEYGTTTGLGQQTSPQVVNSYSYTNFFDTINTVPGTTYYFRAVAMVNGTVARGGILSFTTPVVATTTVITRPVTTIVRGTTVATQNIGFGSPLIQLSISDQFQNVAVGNMVNYTITWHNISNQVLSNAVLNVVLPAGVTFQQASQGLLTTNNTVVANIGTLALDASGSMTIQAVVDANVVPGSNLVATATLAFTTPNNAQDSAIAYDVDTVGAQSQLAGLALFGGGFFPSTLLGWILLLAIIIIVILLARHYTRPQVVKTTTVQTPIDYGHGAARTTTTTMSADHLDHLPH